MKLNVDFSGLEAAVRQMGAEPVEFSIGDQCQRLALAVPCARHGDGRVNRLTGSRFASTPQTVARGRRRETAERDLVVQGEPQPSVGYRPVPVPRCLDAYHRTARAGKARSLRSLDGLADMLGGDPPASRGSGTDLHQVNQRPCCCSQYRCRLRRR